MDSLTQKVIQTQGGVSDLKPLIKEVGELAYRSLAECWGLGRDDIHEIFADFYPKIPTIIQRFHYTGASFANYVTVCLKYSLKRYRSKKLTSVVVHGLEHEAVDETAQENSMHDFSTQPAIPNLSLLSTGVPGKFKEKRRYHILALRYSWFLSEEQISQLASKLDLPPLTLLDQVERIRQMLLPRHVKKMAIADKRSTCLQRLYALRNKVVAETRPDRLEKARILESRLLERLERLRGQLESLSMLPSLDMIHAVTGVPRTTIAGMLQRLYAKERRRLGLNN